MPPKEVLLKPLVLVMVVMVVLVQEEPPLVLVMAVLVLVEQKVPYQDLELNNQHAYLQKVLTAGYFSVHQPSCQIHHLRHLRPLPPRTPCCSMQDLGNDAHEKLRTMKKNHLHDVNRRISTPINDGWP